MNRLLVTIFFLVALANVITVSGWGSWHNSWNDDDDDDNGWSSKSSKDSHWHGWGRRKYNHKKQYMKKYHHGGRKHHNHHKWGGWKNSWNRWGRDLGAEGMEVKQEDVTGDSLGE